MLSPTKSKAIRCDRQGDGAFLARRGHRRHRGTDFFCEPGQAVFAPFDGTVDRKVIAYADDHRFTGLTIKRKHLLCMLLYLTPLDEIVGKFVKRGDVVGTAQDIRKRYGNSMQPHIHCEVWIDPGLMVKCRDGDETDGISKVA